MSKAKALLLITLLIAGILGGCSIKAKEAPANSPAPSEQPAAEAQTVTEAGEAKGALAAETVSFDDTFYKKLYIGEAFKAGYAYIEPFSAEWGASGKAVEPGGYPDTVKFYPVGDSGNIDCYNASFDTVFDAYVPGIEPQSRYFLQSIAQQSQSGLRYTIDAAPDEPQLGIALFGHDITSRDCSVSGKDRLCSESEYNSALDKVKRDNEIKEEDRTLSCIGLENTIAGAKQVCAFYIKDMQLEMLLSEYGTHGAEYAGTVYVVDLIKAGKVLRTYEKYNCDGPY